MEFDLFLSPSPRAAFGLNADVNRFRGGGAATVVTRLIAPEMRLAWNPRLQLTAFYQYNDAARQGTLNARLSWEFRPLSFLSVVVNDARDVDRPALPGPSRQQLLVKLVYFGQRCGHAASRRPDRGLHRQRDRRRPRQAAVDTLRRGHEILRPRLRNVGEGLRVAIREREPRTLDLHHDAMAAPERVRHVRQSTAGAIPVRPRCGRLQLAAEVRQAAGEHRAECLGLCPRPSARVTLGHNTRGL